VIFTAAIVADKEQFVMSGDDLLLAWNTDGANPYTFTVSSVADERNRTGDITTYSLAAGEIGHIRLKKAGWRQSDGKCYIEASNAAIKFAVLTL